MEEPQTSEISAQRGQRTDPGWNAPVPLSFAVSFRLLTSPQEAFTSEAGYWAALVRPGGFYQLLFLAKPWASFPLKAPYTVPGD